MNRPESFRDVNAASKSAAVAVAVVE